MGMNNNHTPMAEQIAARGLLRHYWRQGMDVSDAVVTICAVEGQGTVDEAMARHWFGQFQSDQMGLTDPEEEQGPSRKMVWLPNETWDDVLRFVPFSNLADSISPVSRRFRALAEPILDGLCPRVAKPLQICWDSQELLQRFERCLKILESFWADGEFGAQESSWKIIWERTPMLSMPPPPNIIGFKELVIKGQLDRELLAILAQISTKIEKCCMEFDDLDNFVGTFAAKGIHIDEFFGAMPKVSKLLLVLVKHIPSEFLAHPSVLGCPSLEIHSLEFEADAVLRWLKNPICGQRSTRAKSLYIAGYDPEPADAEPVNLLLGTLISDHRESDGSTPLAYKIELRDFEKLNLVEFEEPGFSLVRDGNIWCLTKEAQLADHEEWDRRRVVTRIRVGKFI